MIRKSGIIINERWEKKELIFPPSSLQINEYMNLASTLYSTSGFRLFIFAMSFLMLYTLYSDFVGSLKPFDESSIIFFPRYSFKEMKEFAMKIATKRRRPKISNKKQHTIAYDEILRNKTNRF